MLILFSLIIIFTFFFFFLQHPLILTIILTAQTINLRIIIFIKKTHSWFSYILFIIFLRGIIIIFIYIRSLASNQPIKFSNKLIYLFFFFLLFILNFSYYQTIFINNPEFFNPFLLRIIKIYEKNIVNFTLILILYLLLVLIVIVNISKKIKFPSRTY